MRCAKVHRVVFYTGKRKGKSEDGEVIERSLGGRVTEKEEIKKIKNKIVFVRARVCVGVVETLRHEESKNRVSFARLVGWFSRMKSYVVEVFVESKSVKIMKDWHRKEGVKKY